MTNERLNEIATRVIGIAIQLHKDIGPGLFESVYSRLLARKLCQAGFRVESEVKIDIEYDGIVISSAFKADLIVNGCLILELKSVEQLEPVHAKQLLTYIRLKDIRLGLLINFGESLLKNGIKRIAN